ncbi:MAG: NAD(P)-dependent oxidoreductase [Ignavibacteriaceae bacterium]|nr:NAD(P)-dependent oxidoreductase [Ignavibacteriaceae bacterium]
MNDKQTAVVTGANGFVGSHLVDLLLENNYIVRCITRKSSNLKWLKDKDVQIFDSGLMDKEGLRKAFNGADYIYHVAGVVKSKKPEGYFKGNVDTTRALLETAVEFKGTIKKFLIVSSQTAVGPSYNGKVITEDDPCNPITTYGRSKLAEEELAKSFMNLLPITICRAPAVFGDRDTEIFIFFRTFNKGLMTTIGFDKKLISLIYVKDLVKGFMLAAESLKSAGQTYFISSEKYYSWDEIGNITSKVLGKNPVKIKVPHSMVYFIAAIAQFFAIFSNKPATLNLEKARDLTRNAWICDTSKAIRELNYHQSFPLEEGIKRTCDWYKSQNWL